MILLPRGSDMLLTRRVGVESENALVTFPTAERFYQ